MCLQPTHIFANKWEWECIIAQTCIQLVGLPLLALSGDILLTPSRQSKTPELHKFVGKVNSENVEYERVATLAKERAMGLLVPKGKIPPKAGMSPHSYYFSYFPLQWIFLNTNSSFQLSQSQDRVVCEM